MCCALVLEVEMKLGSHFALTPMRLRKGVPLSRCRRRFCRSRAEAGAASTTAGAFVALRPAQAAWVSVIGFHVAIDNAPNALLDL